jgi:hypothetical protein
VELEGLNFHVRNKTGRRTYGSGYEELAIKEALDSLTPVRTWREKVLLKGNFPNVDFPAGNYACIDVPSYADLELQGTATMADNVNKSFVANALHESVTARDVFIRVHGGTWECNAAEQTSGHGFDFESNFAGNELIYLYLANLRIHDVNETGIHLESVVAAEIRNIEVGGGLAGSICGLHGINLQVVADSIFSNIGAGANGVGLMLYFCNANVFDNLYLAGVGGVMSSPYNAVLYITRSKGNQFSNIRIDHHYRHGLHMEGSATYKCLANQFSNLSIGDMLTAQPHTYDAIRMDGAGVLYNEVFGLYIGDTVYVGEKYEYAVNEVNVANYNTYKGGHVIKANVDNAGVKVLGANSVWDIVEV